jgi:hypothetical protein
MKDWRLLETEAVKWLAACSTSLVTSTTSSLAWVAASVTVSLIVGFCSSSSVALETIFSVSIGWSCSIWGNSVAAVSPSVAGTTAVVTSSSSVTLGVD